MSKMKDLRKQLKQQLKACEAQIETFGAQADDVEAATLKRAQEQLVQLVDTMDAQLKVWQNSMAAASPKVNGSKTNSRKTNGRVATLSVSALSDLLSEKSSDERSDECSDQSSETLSVWQSMEREIAQWLSTTATIRMAVGADVLWQLETLHALDATANEQLRALKNAQNGAQDALYATATTSLDDLKHALKRVFPEQAPSL